LVGQHNRLLASRHAEKGKNIRGKKTITDQENDEERDYEDLDDEGKDEEELSPQERKPLCTKVTGKAHGKKHKDSQGETPKQPQKQVFSETKGASQSTSQKRPVGPNLQDGSGKAKGRRLLDSDSMSPKQLVNSSTSGISKRNNMQSNGLQ
jgi:hypothetical protein